MEEVIKVSNLTRKYKDFSLGPVDLSFPKGFATALIGANGAGKTTLMDIICGITAKTDGTVTYFGETDNADRQRQYQGAHRLLCITGDVPG